MAQHDYDIANQAGAAFRSDLNNALSAIATNNSGTTAPSTTFAYQWHVDTDAPATLYIRNGANNAYIEVGDVTLDNLGLQKFRRATAQASTSGTAIDFTGIPSWANHIVMMLNGVSTGGTGKALVQLGTASGFVTSGYNSNANTMGNATSTYETSGFLLETAGLSTFRRSGLVDMYRIDGNVWVYASTIKQADTSGTTTTSNDNGAGNSGNLGAVLTQVRLTTDAGDTFDAGTVNIVYES
jgi:hypothetical protein